MSDITEKNPKGAGRKKGTRNTRPKITPADIKRAEMMFITGATIATIQKALNITSTNVLYRHIEKEGWFQKREKFLAEREQNYLKQVMEQAKKDDDAILDDLKTIKDKALEGIQNLDTTKVRLGEAGQTFISATQMERQLKSETIEFSFISIVAKVLKECIQDPKILSLVSDRLKKELDIYRGRPLVIPEPKVEIIENATE